MFHQTLLRFLSRVLHRKKSTNKIRRTQSRTSRISYTSPDTFVSNRTTSTSYSLTSSIQTLKQFDKNADSIMDSISSSTITSKNDNNTTNENDKSPDYNSVITSPVIQINDHQDKRKHYFVKNGTTNNFKKNEIGNQLPPKNIKKHGKKHHRRHHMERNSSPGLTYDMTKTHIIPIHNKDKGISTHALLIPMSTCRAVSSDNLKNSNNVTSFMTPSSSSSSPSPSTSRLSLNNSHMNNNHPSTSSPTENNDNLLNRWMRNFQVIRARCYKNEMNGSLVDQLSPGGSIPSIATADTIISSLKNEGKIRRSESFHECKNLDYSEKVLLRLQNKFNVINVVQRGINSVDRHVTKQVLLRCIAAFKFHDMPLNKWKENELQASTEVVSIRRLITLKPNMNYLEKNLRFWDFEKKFWIADADDHLAREDDFHIYRFIVEVATRYLRVEKLFGLFAETLQHTRATIMEYLQKNDWNEISSIKDLRKLH
ncbi:hypothetical protein SNEBB_010139 [Seison nebaliae]|nr:hypothetical protein SNEBB_010139 [Seison nebaliae]